jgi:hypothetical protein
VDRVPDPLLIKSSSAGNRTRTSGSVARISDHQIIDAVLSYKYNDIIFYVKFGSIFSSQLRNFNRNLSYRLMFPFLFKASHLS